MQPVFEYIPNVFPDQDDLFLSFTNHLEWFRRNDASRDEIYIYRDSKKKPNARIEHVWSHIEKMTGVKYNSCCAERYLTEKDGFSWRSDSGKSVDLDRPLVIANFGGSREISFKEFGPAAGEAMFTKYLVGGGVLVLPPQFPKYFRYRMHGDKYANQLVTLTFREILFS